MSITIMAARSASESGYLPQLRLSMMDLLFSSHVWFISFCSCVERVEEMFSASARSACC